MKSIRICAAVFLLLALAAAKDATKPGPKHQVIEAKVKDSELQKMLAEGKEFQLPQLRVYDKQGRQVADFSGFDDEKFKIDLSKVLQAPAPVEGKPSLQSELALLSDLKNRSLPELAVADFTIVEFWAEWGDPGLCAARPGARRPVHAHRAPRLRG